MGTAVLTVVALNLSNTDYKTARDQLIAAINNFNNNVGGVNPGGIVLKLQNSSFQE